MDQDQKLKRLIEDLLQDRLEDAKIQQAMEELGVPYSKNPTTRWKFLLEKLGSDEQQETAL